jgi:transcriptional regulator with GAF, ATPase, and Fis domain
MECSVCHQPTEPSTSAYSDTLQRRVCFDCIRRLRAVEWEIERRRILSAMEQAHLNRTLAANLLGINVRLLQYKLLAYSQPERFRPR